MTAMEIAASKEWNNLWIETDSELLVLAFKFAKLVCWSLSNRWFNCLKISSNRNIMVSHIYREDNHCANGLAKVGLNLNSCIIWNEIPLEIRDGYDSNRFGKPFFRFVHS
jgi:ribonuclease HI